MGFLVTRALAFGACIRAPNSSKLPSRLSAKNPIVKILGTFSPQISKYV